MYVCVCGWVCVCLCGCVWVRVDVWVMTTHMCFTQTLPTQPNQPASGHVLFGMVFWAGNAHTTYDRDVDGRGSTLLVGILVVQGWAKWCVT